MRTIEREETETAERTDTLESSSKSWLVFPARRIALWLRERLTPDEARRPSHRTLLIASSLIFLTALGVRLLYRQDTAVVVAQGDSLITGLLKEYRLEAQRMIEDGGIVFPNSPDPQNARMILHPPGYSILLAGLYGNNVATGPYTSLQLIQVVADAAAAVLVFFIALELLPIGAAIIAGLLVAFSPHMAFYSLWLTPDSLAVPPILIAIYLIIRASKRPHLVTIIAAGAMIGLSCWLRTNALLLAPFLALVVPLLFERGKRLRYSLALIAATIITISPITIRNWIVFHRFIPLSLSSGLNLVQGIGEFDHEGRFDMPKMDRDALRKDVVWHDRPDYGGNLWSPDGIERDQYRFRRGLEVIRSHPFWFAGVMLRRAAYMLTYDKPFSTEWTFYTVMVPLVSAEPSFGHDLSISDDSQPSLSSTAADLIANGAALSPQAQLVLAADRQALLIAGDDSEFGDQFASAPIPLESSTDYLLTLYVDSVSGPMAVKITGRDRRIALSSKVLTLPDKTSKKRNSRKDEQTGRPVASVEQETAQIKMPFASGNRTEVLLVISNNGASSVRPEAHVRRSDLYKLGPTPAVWTTFARQLVRGIEKNLYTTRLMAPMILLGICLLSISHRRRALVILLATPVYYIGLHSAFCTEYRYILAIHYFLFIVAAVTLYCVGLMMRQGVGLMRRKH